MNGCPPSTKQMHEVDRHCIRQLPPPQTATKENRDWEYPAVQAIHSALPVREVGHTFALHGPSMFQLITGHLTPALPRLIRKSLIISVDYRLLSHSATPTPTAYPPRKMPLTIGTPRKPNIYIFGQNSLFQLCRAVYTFLVSSP